MAVYGPAMTIFVSPASDAVLTQVQIVTLQTASALMVVIVVTIVTVCLDLFVSKLQKSVFHASMDYNAIRQNAAFQPASVDLPLILRAHRPGSSQSCKHSFAAKRI